MKKKMIFAVLALPAMFGAFKVTDRVTFNRDEWLADFEQLKQEIENNYANLKWARSSKDVDLVELSRTTERALQQARTRSEARAALAGFIDGFKDSHFHIESGPPRPIAALLNLWPEGDEPQIDFSMDATNACSAFGFQRKRHSLELDHPSLNEGATTEFAAGVLTLDSGRKFGVIRIPLFQQYHYAASCERAWESFKRDRQGECNDECQGEFYEVAKHEAAAQLAREANALVKRAPDGVVIDLTGNGGGTEWADNAAAALTPSALKPPAVAFVRGPHWIQAFQSDADEFRKSGSAPALLIARAMQDSARVECNVSGVWVELSFAPACWNVVTQTPYSTSYPEALRQRSPYAGRLFIMVDERTASASELFTAVLQDNKAATVIGTATMGVGCGYTNGGIDVKLRNSGLSIVMPDCARLRADGSNEYEGVKPDIVAEWGESTATKAAALVEALRSVN